MGRHTRAYVQEAAHGPLELREVWLDEPGPHEVLLEMRAAGVCHSQVYFLGQPREEPQLFGHEGYARVLATGSAVTKVSVDDHVLVTWIPDNRGDRRAPAIGAVNLQDGRRAVSPQIYVWAEHAVLDEKYLVPLNRAGMRDSLVSIVGCAVPTGVGAVRNTGQVRAGDHVAVIGLGGVGLSAVQGARLAGADRIYAIDLRPEKAELALRLGATDAIVSTDAALEQILATERPGLGRGVDLVVDCVGRDTTLALAMEAVRAGVRGVHRGGSIVLVGVPEEPIPLDLFALFTQEKTILGSLGGSSSHDDLVDLTGLFADGELDLASLVTDRYGFEDIPRAVEDLTLGKVLGRSIVTF